ncbi:MAG TPA: hypothetical protein DCY88_09550 [Cyanobacteria bacterium UBA11372]|nr:hypothetical protein [Cyanobacteria bacterium UBA11372]
MAKNDGRNRATNVRIDGMTPEQQKQMTDHIMDGKRKIAPDARLTIVEGSQHQLSSGHVKQLDSADE